MLRNVLNKVKIIKRSPNSGLVVPKRFNQSAQTTGDFNQFTQELTLWETKDRTSLWFTLPEAPGVLNKALNILTSN